MYAILTDPTTRALSYAAVPTPSPRDDEVLIRVHAAGVNRADLMQREGNYPPPPGCPEWMGLEVSGEVCACGAIAAEHWQIGDKVCALLGGGGYAEFVAVRYDMCLPVPDGISMVEAAAIPEAFATAYLNLFREAYAKAGDTVLVTAGGSGLASVMIPMAKAAGLHVITTVRSAEKAAAIARLGADVVLNTQELPLSAYFAAHPQTVDIAVDWVGGAEVGACLPYMARGGRWIVIASLGGEKTTVDLRQLYVRGVRLVGSTLRAREPAVKAEILSSLRRDFFPSIASGALRPTVCATFPIAEAEAAQNMLYQSKNVGKVVLTVR